MSLDLWISFEELAIKLLDDIGAELFESRDGLFDNCDGGRGKCHVDAACAMLSEYQMSVRLCADSSVTGAAWGRGVIKTERVAIISI